MTQGLRPSRRSAIPDPRYPMPPTWDTELKEIAPGVYAYVQVTLKREARQRYDARTTPGAAAADIRMGRFDNWIGPERVIMDTVRFYDEFAGTLTPDVNVTGNQRAIEEYNSLRRSR